MRQQPKGEAGPSARGGKAAATSPGWDVSAGEAGDRMPTSPTRGGCLHGANDHMGRAQWVEVKAKISSWLFTAGSFDVIHEFIQKCFLIHYCSTVIIVILTYKVCMLR